MSPTENRQIADLKEIVEKQGEEMKSLVASIIHIQEGNNRIEILLIGDKYTKGKGLIDKVEALEQKQSSIESALSVFKSKWAGGVLVLVAISAVMAFLYYATSIFHNLSN
jgi:hypothetical protein